jgi:predicted RNase H-like HicB family nuclease
VAALIVRHRPCIGLKRKFTVVIERKGEEYVASCRELADVLARGSSKQDVLEKITAAIIKKLGEGGSDAGSAPVPHPVRPSPSGPILGLHEKPDV